MWDKEEMVDETKGKAKKAAGEPTHDKEPHGAGNADMAQRPEDEGANPTRPPVIPGQGMTSNGPEDA